MENKPKISVLIPCHNISKLNHFSLKDVIKNKYENMEIILLNDYSSDNTLEVLREYERKDARIKVYNLADHHKRVGLGFNRHFLIEKSTGDYFIFIDDDDYMKPKTLEILANEIDEKNSQELVVCNVKIFFNICKKLFIPIPRVPNYCNLKIKSAEDYYFYRFAFSWGYLVKREYYEKITRKFNQKYDGPIFEDLRFTYLLFLDKPCWKYVKKNLFRYYSRPNSVNSQISSLQEKTEAHIKAFEFVLSKIKQFELLSKEKFEILKNIYYSQMKNLLIASTFFHYKKIGKANMFEALKMINDFKEKYDAKNPKRLNFFSKFVDWQFNKINKKYFLKKTI